MSTKIDPKTLLTHGLHLGHKKNKVHPKSYKYVHSYQQGISIIDLFQTQTLFENALTYISSLKKDGKVILVVATKKVAREEVSRMCEEHDIPYMTNKWVGGFLTNFDEVSKNVKNMNDMLEAMQNGEWNSIIKHERIKKEKELNKIRNIYRGVAKLSKLPDAIFIIDIKKEANAVKEALRVGIPIIAVVDSNVNPEEITYPIPANDDAVTSISYITQMIAQEYSGVHSTKPAKVKEIPSEEVESSDSVEETVEEKPEPKEKKVVKKAAKKAKTETKEKKTVKKVTKAKK